MDTLYNLALFMPFAVAVIWCVMGFLKWRKTFKTWMSNLLLVHTTIYTYAFSAMLVTPADFSLFGLYDVLCVVSGLSIVPCVWFYLISLKGLRANNVARTIVLVPITTIGLLTAVLYIMLGPDQSTLYNENWLLGTPFVPENPQLVNLLDLVTTYLHRSLLVLEVIAFMIYIIWDARGLKNYFKAFMDYLVRKETVSVYNAQMVMFSILFMTFFVRVAMPEQFLIEHHLLTGCMSVVQAVILAIICYTTLFNDVKEISIVDFFCPVVPSSALEEMPEAMMPQDEPVLTSSDSAFGLKVNRNEEFAYTPLPENVLIPLRDAFKAHVEDGKKYLQKGLTLAQIADDIQSNKNYLSRMVHMTYNMTFPEYINKKRIEYAKEVLLEEPDIKQEVLADECGFANASAFNRAFKRETNTTPRMWLVEQKQSNSLNS